MMLSLASPHAAAVLASMHRPICSGAMAVRGEHRLCYLLRCQLGACGNKIDTAPALRASQLWGHQAAHELIELHHLQGTEHRARLTAKSICA